MKVSLKAFRARALCQHRAGALGPASWASRRHCSRSKLHHIVQAASVDVAPSTEGAHQPWPLPAAEEAGTGAPSTSGSCGNDEVLKLTTLLPPAVRARLDAHPRLAELLEVVLDLGRPPLARFPGGDERLAEAAVSREDLAHAVSQVGEFGSDNRAGIDRTLHRISALRNRRGAVVGLTCRVGRAIPGSAAMLADLAASGRSILLLGRPGVGKTTAIRDLARLLASEAGGRRRVVVVDTSNEVGGDGDVPHAGLGGARRMQVAVAEEQHRVMIEAVENHMPEVIVIDEIGTLEEAVAARTIAQRGVQLIATAHGNQLENVMKNPSLMDLVGGICSVTLGDEEARRRGVQKSVLEREHPPTFDVCVEMGSRDQWRVHADVAEAVDAILAGRQPVAEVRERDESGRVWSWSDGGSTDFEDGDGSGDEAAAAEAASSSSSSRGGGRRGELEQQQRQAGAGSGSSFPPDALRAARLGAALQAAGEVPAVAAALARAASGGGASASSASTGSSASSGPLRVYPLGLDQEQVLGAAAALGLGARLALAARVQEADAVLALRARLKSSGWVRGAAKAAGVPVFALRSGEPPELARAVRALLGADGPSRRGRAPPAGRGGGGGGVSEAADVLGGSFLGGSGTGARGAGAGAGSSAAEETDALEEARLAIESLVLANNQPVELLPRSASLMELQTQLAWQRYRLPVEVVGAEDRRRLRVLPPDCAPAVAGIVRSGVAEPALEGGRAVEYW